MRRVCNFITTIKTAATLVVAVFVLSLLSSCGNSDTRYRIGFSQCVGGAWREKVNQEMLSAQHLYNNVVKVDIKNADNDSKKQVRQIDSLVASGIDLLVVAPNEYKAITPAIVRARSHGIPVILFDRKVNTNDYSAYIGGDNIAAGKAMGHYALSLISERSYDHKPRILELTGGTTSSPAIDRHKGFSSVMKGSNDVDYNFVNTDWTSEQTYATMKSYLRSQPIPDIVFCHSDLAAFNAYNAAKDLGKEKQILFLGIDGLPGKDGGIEAVEKGILAGTYIYPTHGEQIVKLALDILQKKSYKHENIMRSVIVTPDNAPVIMQSSEEMMQQSKDLLTLQDKIENLFGLYNTQRMLFFVSIIAIFILVIALILIWRVVVITRRINHKEKQLNREQTLFYTNARHQLRTPLTLIDGPLAELADSKEIAGKDKELVDILQRNVEQLSGIVYNVLSFKNDAPTLVSDDNIPKSVSTPLSFGEGTVENPEGSGERISSLSSILVVDDNSDMRRYIRTLLADKYYVMEADDGEKGLQVARENIPDLIVSDVMMPVMDGLQFCRKIKEDPMTSHIPVILLTARSTEEQLVEGLGTGADAYMTKPFSAQVLLARIDNLLKSRQQLRHLFDGKAKEETKKEEEQLSVPDRTFIDRFKEAVDKHLSESNLKMDDLGAELGISRVQLYRKVKALTGQSPVELLRQIRLQKAYALLQHTDSTVSEVAYDVGFSSPGYFTTCFKKQFGKYPTEVSHS